ncbi:hypothetical protein KEM56_004936, partial [Ascosphaera pollenicola]
RLREDEKEAEFPIHIALRKNIKRISTILISQVLETIKRSTNAWIRLYKQSVESLLTVADSGGIDSADEEGPFDDSALRTEDQDTLLPRACSPSPEPSNPGATTVLPNNGGSQMPTTSKSKKWRRLSHWLKPMGGKNDKSL